MNHDKLNIHMDWVREEYDSADPILLHQKLSNVESLKLIKLIEI